MPRSHPFRFFAPLALALALTVSAASAQVAFPLAAPPVAGNAAAGAIFDAMLAISRATLTNPQAAQAASFSYAAAIQRYHAGDLAAARQQAVQAQFQAAMPAGTVPNVAAPAPLALPALTPMRITNPAQADAEAFLALSRRSLLNCSASPDQRTQLEARYEGAVRENLTHNYEAVRRDAKTIIDGCAHP
jgi:hypothetical protein